MIRARRTAAGGIAIVKLSSLGDVIHALPVARALRRALPGAHLTWIVEAREYAILRDHPDLDAVVPVDTRLWRRLHPAPGRACARWWARSAGCARRIRARRASTWPSTCRGSSRAGSSPPTRGAPAAHRLHRRALPRAAERALHQPARDAARRGAVHVVEQYLSLLGAARHRAGRRPSSTCPSAPAADRRMEDFLVEQGVKRPRPAGRDQSRARAARTSAGRSRISRALADRLATRGGRAPPRCSGAPTRRTWPGEIRDGLAGARALLAPPTDLDELAAPAAPRRAHDRQRHGAAAPGGGARHAVPRPLRADARRAQRALRAALPRAPEPRRHAWRASASGAVFDAALRACSTRGGPRVSRLTRDHHRVERGGAAARLPRERGVGRRDRGGRRRVDATRRSQIAREFTDSVWVRPWPGFAVQKNFAIEQATGDWILSLDADERVTPELRDAHPRDPRGRTARPTATRSRAEPLLGRLGAPRRPLSRLPAPALPPGRGALRGERGPRVGHGRRAGGDAGRGRCSTSRTATSRTSSRRSNRYSTLAAQDWIRRGRRVEPGRARDSAPRAASSPCTLCSRGFLDGWRGLRARRPLRRVRVPAHGQGLGGPPRAGTARGDCDGHDRSARSRAVGDAADGQAAPRATTWARSTTGCGCRTTTTASTSSPTGTC